MAGLELYERDELKQVVGRLDLTSSAETLARELSFVVYLARCYGAIIDQDELSRPPGCGTDEANFTIQYGGDAAYDGACRALRKYFEKGVISQAVDVNFKRYVGSGHEVRQILQAMNALPPA